MAAETTQPAGLPRTAGAARGSQPGLAEGLPGEEGESEPLCLLLGRRALWRVRSPLGGGGTDVSPHSEPGATQRPHRKSSTSL